ncbi:MAG: 1-acyl-sn-glycerol-3-phosphate acyltransferase [Phycisphaerales bacterium]|nr:1-acyl-sn-glycerol-3-phosphate acyltransferase [Phycisphaerales bacterium]
MSALPDRILHWRRNHPGRSLASAIFFECCRGACHLLFTVLYRFRRFGLHNIPATGPLIIVSNHQSHLDPIAVGALLAPRATHPIARIGLFKFKPFGWLIKSLNSIPIRQGEPDTAAIREALVRLESGAPVLIFAEGSRTFDGELQEFQRGVLLLLRRARCPVLPIAIDGAFDAWPRTRTFPRLFGQRLAMAAGKVIQPEELLASDDALERLRTEIESLRALCARKLYTQSHRSQ